MISFRLEQVGRKFLTQPKSHGCKNFLKNFQTASELLTTTKGQLKLVVVSTQWARQVKKKKKPCLVLFVPLKNGNKIPAQ